MTPSRNKNGQFAPKNPDCEPATKGFVKCVARKLITHKHCTDRDHLTTYIVISNLLIFAISFAILGILFDTDKTMIGFMCVVCICISLLLILFAGSEYTHPDTSDVNFDTTIMTAIQKYEPPKCEQKKECGED